MDELLSIRTHLSRRLARTYAVRPLYAVDARGGGPPQDVREQVPWNSHLGRLEDDVAGVADDLRCDLDQFLLERRQRPIFRL